MNKRRLIVSLPFLLSANILEGRAEATTKVPVCLPPANPAGFSVQHVGPPGLPGAMYNMAFSDDGTTGVGVLQLTTDVTDSMLVRLTLDGTKLKNYIVTAPCNGSSMWTTGTHPQQFQCANGVVLGQPVTTGNGTKAHPYVTTNPAWSAKIQTAFDADDDVLLAKLVQTSALTGINSLCGQLWYVLGATPAAPTTCINNNDCQVTTQPTGDVACDVNGQYGGQGGICGAQPIPTGDIGCMGTGNVPFIDQVGSQWQWYITPNNLACATVDGVSTCTACPEWSTTVDPQGPECNVLVWDPLASVTWSVGYDPFNQVVYFGEYAGNMSGMAFTDLTSQQASIAGWTPNCTGQ